MDGVAHFIIINEPSTVIEDIQIVARPGDDALFGRVIIGIGSDLVAPFITACRRDAVQSGSIVKDNAVAERRDILAERRADPRHPADALAGIALQRIGHGNDKDADQRHNEDRHPEIVLEGILLFIFLLFLVVHPISAERTIRACEVRNASFITVHVNFLSRGRGGNVGALPQTPPRT